MLSAVCRRLWEQEGKAIKEFISFYFHPPPEIQKDVGNVLFILLIHQVYLKYMMVSTGFLH